MVDQAIGAEKLQTDVPIGTQNHKQWIENYDSSISKIGNCGGYVYDDHYVAGIAIETGDSLNTYSTSLSVIFGTLLGGGSSLVFTKHPIGGLIGGAIGGILGVVVDSVFFSHYDLSGRTFTLLAYDDHVGALNEEAVRFGGFPGYDADAGPGRAVVSPAKVSGPHLEIGKEITDYV